MNPRRFSESSDRGGCRERGKTGGRGKSSGGDFTLVRRMRKGWCRSDRRGFRKRQNSRKDKKGTRDGLFFFKGAHSPVMSQSM